MSALEVPVEGLVEPGWGIVRDAFLAGFADGSEIGAACAVYHRGRLVVDLWGGWFDRDRTVPYPRDALQLVFSTTKGVAAVLVARLVEAGLVDPDAPLASYWPEFAAEGKGTVTVGQALSHQAGVPAVDAPLTLDDVLAWDPIVEALAHQAPLWIPGTDHGYHAMTYGWLAGELVRRVTGKRPGALLAEEVAGPLGLDLWIGLPPEEEHRVSRLVAAPPPTDPELRRHLGRVMGPGTLGARALTLDGVVGNVWNKPAVHAAEILGANAVTDARSLARLYAATVSEVDGVRLLSPATVELVREERVSGPDRVLVTDTRFGLGFMLPHDAEPLGGDGSFGHPGAGGSIGWAWPEGELAVGYVMNQMGADVTGDPRASRISAAARAASMVH